MKRPAARNLPPTRKPQPPRNRQRDLGEIAHGTVGHNDGSSHFDLEDGGIPLLKVTLFQGFNVTTQGENKNPTRAMGRKVLARFDGKRSDIPNDGELVILARPAGLQEGPASYYVIGRPMPDPKWVPNRKSGEQIIFGPNDSFIRFKDDGTIYLFVKSGTGDGAQPIYAKLHAKGFEVRHPHGRLRSDDMGFEMAHSSGATVSGGAISGLPAPLSALSSFLNLKAAIVKIQATATSIGGSSGQDNVMKATSTLSTLASMQAAIEAIQTALALVVADLVSAAAAPAVAYVPTFNPAAVAVLATAITASSGAISTAVVNAPTQGLAAG